MVELKPGVETSDVTGYLQLSPEILQTLISSNLISEDYDVQDTPFAR